MRDDRLPQVTSAALARIEEAGLNAAQPPEQLLFDGWLLRFSPGKARRARSVQALTAGQLAIDEKLDAVRGWYAAQGLPPLVRITPFSQPPQLDAELARRGWKKFELSCVMSAPLDAIAAEEPPSLKAQVETVDADAFALAVGRLRGSPAEQVVAHARWLQASPLRASTTRLLVRADGEVVAAGQVVVERELAGLYDIVTATAYRGRGLGESVCRRLLDCARGAFARAAYLQVGVDNDAARRLYARLGFVEQYPYWYRQPADAGDPTPH